MLNFLQHENYEKDQLSTRLQQEKTSECPWHRIVANRSLLNGEKDIFLFPYLLETRTMGQKETNHYKTSSCGTAQSDAERIHPTPGTKRIKFVEKWA